jgi:tRNA 2-thiouridine synthesizing protein A
MPLPAPDDPDEQPGLPTKLLGELDRSTGARCADCARAVCGHEALFSVALGFKDAPRCLACLAKGLGDEPSDLRDRLAEHFRHRNCFRTAWAVACDREGFGHTSRPGCLWPGGEMAPSGPRSPREQDAPSAAPAAGAAWDAGDMACGDLVLALRLRMNTLPAGGVLKVTARDPAAPLDLPAWCRLTGHRLLRAAHPDYHIQRKES